MLGADKVTFLRVTAEQMGSHLGRTSADVVAVFVLTGEFFDRSPLHVDLGVLG